MATDDTDDLIISISTDQATLRRSIQRIERDLSGLAGSVQKQFAAVGKSIDNSVSTTMQNRINAMVGIGTKAANEWTGALADQGKELERLRARYSPLFATINSYKMAVADIRRAHAVGAISANEMAAAISRERQAALASTAAIKGRTAALSASHSATSGGSFQTANIAAQFQDIAVTSAMGMNPLQIALQQGTQLSSVIQTMGNGRGIITGLAAAFTSLVSPVSLVTIGLVAGGAAAIQYFSAILNSDDASEKLKEQAQLIQSLADKWGDAIPALRDYANELQRAKEAADLKEGVSLINEKTLERIKGQLGDARVSIGALVQDLRAAGEEDEVIKRLQVALNQFVKSADEGKLKTEEVKSVQDALAGVVQGKGIPALAEFAKLFDTLSKSALAASESVGKVNDEAARMLPMSTWRSYNKQTGQLETNAQPGDDNIQNPGFMTPEIGPVPESRPLRELNAPEDQKKVETAAQRAANAYRDLLKSADDRIAQMRQEIDLIGAYGVEADAARFKLDLLQQAEDKGRSLSEAQRKELEGKVDLYRRYSAELSKAKLAQDLMQQQRFNSLTAQDQQIVTTLRQYGLPDDLNSSQAGQIRQSLRDEAFRDDVKAFASDFKNALLNNGGDIGKAFAESIQRALLEQASRLWDDIIQRLFSGLTAPGSSSSAGSSLASAIGGNASGRAPVIPVARSSLPDIVGMTKSGNQLTTISSAGGLSTSVNASYASNFQGFINDLEAGGYRISSLGGYNHRNIAGTNRLSNHAFGNAIDINPLTNPMGRSLVTDMPANVGDMASKWGLSWGGNWNSKKDAMHFEVNPASDALAKLASSTGAATKGLDTFGGGLGKIGQSLSGTFPAAPAAPGGGIGIGGWLSSLFSPNLSKYQGMVGLFAGGGDVRGPGTGTSDSIPALLSDGEFVVNANATRKHRALLQAINNGRIGRFADGGLVRAVGVPSVPQLRGRQAAQNDNREPGVLIVRIDGANGDDHVRKLVQQGVSDGLGQYNTQQQRGGFGTVQGQFSKRKV